MDTPMWIRRGNWPPACSKRERRSSRWWVIAWFIGWWLLREIQKITLMRSPLKRLPFIQNGENVLWVIQSSKAPCFIRWECLKVFQGRIYRTSNTWIDKLDSIRSVVILRCAEKENFRNIVPNSRNWRQSAVGTRDAKEVEIPVNGPWTQSKCKRTTQISILTLFLNFIIYFWNFIVFR